MANRKYLKKLFAPASSNSPRSPLNTSTLPLLFIFDARSSLVKIAHAENRPKQTQGQQAKKRKTNMIRGADKNETNTIRDTASKVRTKKQAAIDRMV